MSRRLLGGGLVGAAILGAAVPLEPLAVERWYSRGVYPRLQGALTPWTDLAPVAIIDALIVGALVVAAGWVWVKARPALQSRRPGRLLSCAFDAAAAFAAVYVLFLAMWGFNYRRLPLEAQLEFDPGRVSVESVWGLAERAVEELNALHARTAGQDWPEFRDLPVLLGPAFEATQRQLGSVRPAVPARPKHTLLAPYFRLTSVDGMLNPVALEVVVSQEVLPFERPFLVAHEWAHLAGYASEAEASFVGWLVCQDGDDLSRYSAWMYLYPQLLRALTVEEREALAGRLAEGPRAHMRDVSLRLRRSSPVVQRTASRVYDRYLRANRVEAGIASYGQVVPLLLGTRFEPDWRPLLRPDAAGGPGEHAGAAIWRRSR